MGGQKKHSAIPRKSGRMSFASAVLLLLGLLSAILLMYGTFYIAGKYSFSSVINENENQLVEKMIDGQAKTRNPTFSIANTENENESENENENESERNLFEKENFDRSKNEVIQENDNDIKLEKDHEENVNTDIKEEENLKIGKEIVEINEEREGEDVMKSEEIMPVIPQEIGKIRCH